MNATEPPMPECKRLHAVKDKSQAIGEFLDWLQSERKVFLATIHRHTDECEHWSNGRRRYTCDYANGAYAPFHASTEKLLAEFFEIDLNKVEQERRALLDHLRATQQLNAM